MAFDEHISGNLARCLGNAHFSEVVVVVYRSCAANVLVQEITDFISKVKKTCGYHESVLFVYTQGCDFISIVLGNHATAYKLTKEAQQYFLSQPVVLAAHSYKLESNLGSFSQRDGNYSLSAAHYRESLRLIAKAVNPENENVFIAFNSMGITLWQSSKLDSSLYYFDKAENLLSTMDSSPVNRYYRIAMINNNKSNIYAELGKTRESIAASEKAIQHYRLFIGSPNPDPRKTGATVFQFQAMDNLAKTYGELGDLSKSQD
ncbi:MAG: tetratricopeptide repeat protein, partial [Pedobacter sp.]